MVQIPRTQSYRVTDTQNKYGLMFSKKWAGKSQACKNGQICVQKWSYMCVKMGKYVCKNGQICVGGNGKDHQAKRKKIAETVPDKEGHKKRNDDYNRSFNVKKKL